MNTLMLVIGVLALFDVVKKYAPLIKARVQKYRPTYTAAG